MKGLLVKDIRLLFGQKRFFIIILILSAALINSESVYFAIGYLSSVSAVFVISTLRYDEAENGYSFLMTLPFDRKSYVREKYLFGIMFGCGAWALGFIISIGYQLIRSNNMVLSEFFSGAAVLIPIFMFMLSVLIPLQLKFGGERSQMVMLGCLGAIFLILYLVVKVIEATAFDIEKALNSLSTLHLGVLELILFGIAAVFTFISCTVSVAIMEKKEF